MPSSSTQPIPVDAVGIAVQPPGGSLFLRVFPSIMLPMFLAALDQTIVATALPSIAGSLGDVERVSWVVVSYLVANTIAAPVYGRLGDALGRKRMMFVALAVFIAASVLCALSGSIVMLTFARLLQGARRRRADDAVAGADRRGGAAPPARPIPGLPVGDVRHRRDVRAGGGWLADPAFRLAVGVPGQSAAGRCSRPCW